MNDDLIKVNHQLGRQIELYDKKLSIAIAATLIYTNTF